MKKLLFMLTMVLIFGSCNKDMIGYPEATNSLIVAQRQLASDSTNFFKSNKPNYDYRQSLLREILWSQAKVVGDSVILVPIHLTDKDIPEARISLNGNVWLYARLIDSRWKFDMWTLDAEPGSGTELFTGTLLTEDYFKGDAGYSFYQRGKIVSNREQANLIKRARFEKMASLNRGEPMARSLECNTTWTEVCVGPMGNSNSPDICNRKSLTNCEWVDDDRGLGDHQEVISWIERDDFGGGGPPPRDPKEDVLDELLAELKDNPFALFDDLDCDIVKKWIATARHQIKQAQIDKLNNVVNNIVHASVHGIPVYTIQDVAKVQKINDAYSSVVNMDYFPIKIDQLPIVNGKRLNPAQFMEYMRKNINSFVNTTYSKFEPYRWHGINDEALWNSSDPLNAMIGIDIAGPDNGSFIVSKYNETGWTFTTVYDPKYLKHPVSGNRDFGYTQNTDGSYTFFTRGVDRLTTGFDAGMEKIAFFAADELWKSFQQNVKKFVNTNQGNASIGNVEIKRPDWVQVKDVVDGKKPLSTLSTDCND